jgi:tryptophan synthase beta chain
MHQTVIGEEAIKQLAQTGDTPDVIVGCTGGGSNFGGLAFPFLREKMAGRMNPTIRAVEPAPPVLHQGHARVRLRRHGRFTPLLKMHTLGHEFIPDPIHAGGLRYHGMSPLLSHIYELDYRSNQASVGMLRGGLAVRPYRNRPVPEPLTR